MFSSLSLHRPLALFTVAAAVTLPASVAYAADPSPSECLAAHESAVTLQDKHELRAARARLDVCASASCPAGLRATCTSEGVRVRRATPTLILDAVDAAGNDVSAVKVTMDGAPLTDHIDGSSVTVDPGAHLFTFQVAGRPMEQQALVMTEGEKDRRVRIQIAPPPPEPSHEGETQRLIGLAFGGTAVAAAGVATVFGLIARGNLSKSHQDCESVTSCVNEPRAASELQSANDQATISTGGFIAAGAFLVAGGMLFFTAPTAKRPSTSASATLSLAPGVGPGSGSMLLRGTF